MKFNFLKFYGLVLLPTLFSVPIWAIASDNEAQKGESTWSYTGATGPSHWGELSPEYATCEQGKNQSPININRSFDARLPSIKFDYSMLIPEDIVNNGHSIQVNIRNGGLIKLDGKDFILKQFHFHTPSETMIDDVSYPLEAHFVHASKDNELAVVALLYQPGMDSPALDVLLKSLPMNAGESNRLGAKDMELFERSKKVSEYFRFNGSLTTPPCTEGVRWIVLKTMPSMSIRQLRAFQQALKHPNNRPIQPKNARIIVR